MKIGFFEIKSFSKQLLLLPYNYTMGISCMYDCQSVMHSIVYTYSAEYVILEHEKKFHHNLR